MLYCSSLYRLECKNSKQHRLNSKLSDSEKPASEAHIINNGSNLQKESGEKGGKQLWRRGEESRGTGTYNPDAFLMQFQACPWSSAKLSAAQHSLMLGSRAVE